MYECSSMLQNKSKEIKSIYVDKSLDNSSTS